MLKTNFIFIILFFFIANAFGNNIILKKEPSVKNAGKFIEILNNHNKKYNSTNVTGAKEFYKSTQDAPVFSTLNIDVWIRVTVTNNMLTKNVYFSFNHPNTSLITLYKDSLNKLTKIYFDGNSIPHTSSNTLPNYSFNVNQQLGNTVTYYINFQSYHPLVIDLMVGTYGGVSQRINKKLNLITVYLGILLAIFFYNLFLFFVVGDKSYLLYTSYIFFLGLAQFNLLGYLFKYIWYAYPSINYYAVAVSSSLAIIFGILFSMNFLRTKIYTVVTHKLFIVALIMCGVAITASLLHFNQTAYMLIVVLQVFVGLLGIIAAINIYSKGYRPALYYAISWTFFLTCLIIYSFRNFNLIPANNFTNYILYIGSSIEMILLSIALADRINVLKKEKEESQADALRQARANEQLVSQQNVVLEEKVASRTHELSSANNQLNEALVNLKDTQTQLVEAEKMASLGQLTAGIAHEINNPINFVKSNINPLRLDVNDLLSVLNAYDELHNTNDQDNYRDKLGEIQGLKENLDLPFIQTEIDSLILGIEDGAERTAEIVRGLRTFSRIDESELKPVNIHDGISSTTILLKNDIPFYIKLVKQFYAAGEIECFPGKINQVFMNVLTNAVQAIKSKPVKQEEESIVITTRDIEDEQIEISIKDSGPGMTDETKHRIFEPFYTTKDVGEGTGLGMAIVFKIIQKHAGKINIISAPNEGAEFIITLPHKYKGIEQ